MRENVDESLKLDNHVCKMDVNWTNVAMIHIALDLTLNCDGRLMTMLTFDL